MHQQGGAYEALTGAWKEAVGGWAPPDQASGAELRGTTIDGSGDPRVWRQFWDVASAVDIPAEGHGLPVAAEQHRVTNTRRGLDVLRARWQGWDVASAVDINAKGQSLPVAAEQRRVTSTRRGLDVLRAPRGWLGVREGIGKRCSRHQAVKGWWPIRRQPRLSQKSYGCGVSGLALARWNRWPGAAVAPPAVPAAEWWLQTTTKWQQTTTLRGEWWVVGQMEWRAD